MVEKDKELIEKFNKAYVEHLYDLVRFGDSFSFLNHIPIYAYLYGHLPKLTYYAIVDYDTHDINFITHNIGDATSFNNKKAYGLKSENISYLDTCKNMGIEVFPTKEHALYITNIGIIFINSTTCVPNTSITTITLVSIYTDTEENAKSLAETFLNGIVKVDNIQVDDKVEYLWVRSGFNSKNLVSETLSFNRLDVNLSENYNDDLPYDRIIDIVNSTKNELILFNGKPGTGKTTFIKHLMAINRNNNKFLYIDSGLLTSLDSSSFIGFMLGYRDSVVVLEDCEKILSKREQGNPFMGTLLNLTDGIIGESIRAKFICSFNCSEHKIDEALLRKGRLSLKYSFNELCLEKTKKFIPNATMPMTLADIYKNDTVNVIGSTVKMTKIGF